MYVPATSYWRSPARRLNVGSSTRSIRRAWMRSWGLVLRKLGDMSNRRKPQPLQHDARTSNPQTVHQPPQRDSRILIVSLQSVTWLTCAGLVLLVAIPYFQIADHESIVCDDDDYVYENSFVAKGLTWSGVQWAFSAPHAGNYHPLTWLSHMCDVHCFGMHAGAHHLVNMAFHCLNAVLLFLVLYRGTGHHWPSAAAALFSVHPLRVESVAWISERKDVLSGFFWILTMWLYLRYGQRPGVGRYVSVLLAFGCGLLCKSMLVTLPFVLLLWDIWPLRRWKIGNHPNNADSEHLSVAAPKSISHLALEKLPLFFITVAASDATIYSQSGAGAASTLEGIPLSGRILNALVAYVSYLWKTIWPVDLVIFYPHPSSLLRV